MQAVWPDQTVEDNALQVHIVALRKALGGDADRLHTVHGIGYRLEIGSDVGQPDQGLDDDEATGVPRHETAVKEGSNSRLPLFAIAILLSAAAALWFSFQPAATSEANTRPKVAVLPFVAQSSDEEDRYFADGVTEEILNRLDALGELRVLPRTTVFAFRSSDEPINAIAAKLDVDHVVEGSLRRSGENVRVSARLVKAADNETIWSSTYDGKSGDIIEFQSDIAKKVAGALNVLLDEEKLRRMQLVGVDDPQAYALYARAFLMNQAAHADLPNLTRLYESSLELDEAFAASSKLWMAPATASDFYSHMIIDQAAGIEHKYLPSQVRLNAQAEMQKRFDEAELAAPGRTERLAVELTAAAFSDNWAEIPNMATEFYGDHDGCNSSNFAGFLITGFGLVDELAAAYLAMEDCRLNDPSYYGYASRFLGLAGQFDEARALLARGRSREFISDQRIDGYAAAVEALAGNSEGALQLAHQSNSDYNLIWADTLGGKSNRSLEHILEDVDITAWRRLSLLAIAGRNEDADAFAAQIDGRAGGPMLLQMAVDECLCGAPFDIERTPNYAARIRETGLSWPPKSPINWPLKTEPRN